MKVVPFTVLTFLGAYPWCLFLIVSGYLLGENWEDITVYLRPVSIPLAIACVLAVGYFFYRRIRELRREQHEPGPGET